MTPKITLEMHAQFQDVGFFVLEDIFTRQEMNDLAWYIEQFQKQHEESLRTQGGTEGISRAGEITFTAFLAERAEPIRHFCTRQEFVTISTKMLGPDVDLYWNQAVFKGPEGEKPFPWHQDDGYTQVDPSPYLTLWLALSDATVDNGCISVLPGSHHRGLVPHHPSPIGLFCYDLDNPDQGIQVPVRAGSLVVFSSLLFHKSGINRSLDTRKAYVIQYSHAGLRNAATGEVLPNKLPVARGGVPVE